MKEKITSLHKKYPKLFLCSITTILLIIFGGILKIVNLYSLDTYAYITLFLLCISVFLIYGIKIYNRFLIPYLTPYLNRHPKCFTFMFAILPLWLSSFYCIFSLDIQAKFEGYILLIIQSVGCVGFIAAIYITPKWLKTDFSIDKKRITEETAPSLKEALKSDIWMQLKEDPTFKTFFNEKGELKNELPNFFTPPNTTLKLPISKNIILCTLFSFLKDNNFFKEEYTWPELEAITSVKYSTKSIDDTKRYKENRIRFLPDIK